MREKLMVLLSACMVLAMLTFAILFRINVKDTLGSQEERNKMLVPAEDKEFDWVCVNDYKAAKKCPVIITGEAIGEPIFAYQTYYQKVKVKRVIRGGKKNLVKSGQEIKIMCVISIDRQYGRYYVDMQFHDFMRKGDTYLIFMRNPVPSKEEKNGYIYQLDFYNMTNFNYLNLSRNHSFVVPPKPVDNKLLPHLTTYDRVAGSEFAVQDEKILNMVLKYKKRLIKEFT